MATTGYSLTDAATAIKTLPWFTSVISSEPLEGLYDGANKVFRFPAYPVSATPTPVYTDSAGASVTAPTATLDTGLCRFASAPTAPIYVTAVAQLISDTNLLATIRRGFDEMQIRFKRDYFLVESSGLVYVSSSSTSVVDPAVDDLTFSTSSAQRDFFLGCCIFRLISELYQQAVVEAVNLREERSGGLLFDSSKNPANWKILLEITEKDLLLKENAARFELGDEDGFGYFIAGPSLSGFMETF